MCPLPPLDEDNEGDFPRVGLHRPRSCSVRLPAEKETSVNVIDTVLYCKSQCSTVLYYVVMLYLKMSIG